MAADEGRRWPDDYLWGADALRHLEKHHDLNEAQAWARLLEDHASGDVELRYDPSPRPPERARRDSLEPVLFVNRRAALVRVPREALPRKSPSTTSTADRPPDRPAGGA